MGSVHDGHVIDSEGRIIGELNGEDVSQFEGSVVDAEGDVLVSDAKQKTWKPKLMDKSGRRRQCYRTGSPTRISL